MKDDGHFDERVAAIYDDDARAFDPKLVKSIVDFLLDLGGQGRALELGIGTGRTALPLAERGGKVSGIDMSRPMVQRLRAKPGGADVDVTIGDFSTARVSGPFSLVYLVFNTINNLTTQEAQVACFQNAAAHLEPGGLFVIEVGVPPLQRLAQGETKLVFNLDDTHWGIDEFDVVTQAFSSHHVKFLDGEAVRQSIPFRYVWPAELDLMARLAGMSLKERWGGWNREPFTSASTSHISVWQK
ncbi:MAG: class I SAM-dependent DNA methyltransferase [Geminicoccaceae bacterium]